MATATLERGMMLRDLPARTLDGAIARASDFRGRRNLVLVFPVDGEPALLAELRQHAEELLEEEAVVLIADPSGDSANVYGVEHGGSSALYITDRYGEIYFAAHACPELVERAPSRVLPPANEILGWLRFINAQCPE